MNYYITYCAHNLLLNNLRLLSSAQLDTGYNRLRRHCQTSFPWGRLYILCRNTHHLSKLHSNPHDILFRKNKYWIINYFAIYNILCKFQKICVNFRMSQICFCMRHFSLHFIFSIFSKLSFQYKTFLLSLHWWDLDPSSNVVQWPPQNTQLSIPWTSE